MENYNSKKVIKYILEVIQDAVLIIGIVVIIRYFVVSPFQINGSSMRDTFFNGDYIFVEKLSYRFAEPKFQDVVIFTPPVPKVHQLTGFRCLVEHFNELSLDSEVCNYSDKYIKRVIGLPGDVIKIEKGAVYRNGEMLDESEYLSKRNNGNTQLPTFQEQNEFVVPKESIFVLGDNRNGSSDSRYWKSANGENKSFVPYKDLTGRFMLKLFSPEHIFGQKQKPLIIK